MVVFPNTASQTAIAFFLFVLFVVPKGLKAFLVLLTSTVHATDATLVVLPLVSSR